MSIVSSEGAEELDLPPTCGLMILKIIVVNILLSLADQISDFLQVTFPTDFLFKWCQISVKLKVRRLNVVAVQAFNLLFLSWLSDDQAQDWDEYWSEK